MQICLGFTTYLKKFFFLFTLILLSVFSVSTAVAAPKLISFQTKIYKPDGTPLEASAVQFKFSLMNPLSTCVIYAETFSNVDLSSSSGSVVLALGDPVKAVRSYPIAGSMKWYDAFNNTTPNYTCQTTGTFSPTLIDNRRLVMQFNDGGGSGWQTLPPMDINSVPFAMFAELAETVPITGLLQGGATPGQVLKWTGTSWAASTDNSTPSGSVSNVSSATSYLSIANGGTTPVLTINVGTGINTVAAGNDARITGAFQAATNLSGDLTGTLPNAVIAAGAVTNSKITSMAFSKLTSVPTTLVGYNITMTSSDVTTALGYSPGAGGGTVGSVTSASTAGNPIKVSASSTSPSIDISRATASVNGYLASSDFTTFTNKLTSGLLSTKIFVGNSSNFAEAMVLSGDATISNTGMLLINNGAINNAKISDVAFSKISGKPTTLAGYTITMISSDVTTALGYTPGSGSGTVGSVISASTPGNPITVSASSSSPSIDISRATALVNGYLASSDFTTFNNKLNANQAAVEAALGYIPVASGLSSSFIYVGNVSNMAVGVQLSGDATISNTGLLSLSNTGVGVGTYSKLTVDLKGRVTASGVLNSSDITTALGYTPGAGSGTVGAVTSASTSGNPITVSASSTSPSIDISKATAFVNGYLASSDFSIFLAKGSGSVTSATAASTSGNPITVSASSTSPSIDISRATALVNGYLASSDFSIFSAKGSGSVTSATAASTSGNPITVSASSTSPSIDISRATASVNGYLASSDFSIFSAKGSGSVTSATAASTSGNPITVSASSTSPSIDISRATALANGYLASSDFSIFSAKGSGSVTGATSALTTGNPITVSASSTSPSIDISKATALVNGYLASSDFSIFAAKGSGSVTSATAASTSGNPITVSASSTSPSIDISRATASVNGYLASSDFSIFLAKGSGSVTGATSALTAGNPITVSASSTSPSIDISRATALANGYLASSDFSIFAAKGSGSVTGATAAATSGNPITVSASSTSPSIDISRATASVNGYLASSDFSTFNNKLGNNLLSTRIFVGNSSNLAEAFVLSGDATISNTGLLSLSNTGIGAGTYTKVTVDTKGRVTASAALISTDITTALGYTPGAGGGTVGSVTSAATSGNPITVSASSTSPSIDISRATASVNGYLASSDFTTFNNKVSSQWVTNGSGDVSRSSGNVGIGTASPLGKFDVSGSSSSTDLVSFDANRSISMINLDTTANNAQGLALRSTGTNGTSIQSGVKLLGVNTARTATTITTDFAVLTNNAGTITEKMRVLANGNVGIGTTTPGQKLSVAGTIESTSGGIKFPDGTIQTTSAIGGTNNTMVSGFPDVIKCNVSSPAYGVRYLYMNSFSSGYYFYMEPHSDTTNFPAYVYYNPAGVFQGNGSGYTTHDCNVSITALYAAGQAYNFAKGPAGQWLQNGSSNYYNAGNVGIGTTTPAFALSVVGDVNVTGNFKINGSNVGFGSVIGATAAATVGNPITVSASSTSPSIDISRATASVNGYLASSDFSSFTAKQAGSTELTGLAGLASTGFIRRTAANTYSTVASMDLTTQVTGQLPSANIADSSITSAKILNGTITSSDLSSASVEAANLAQMGASTGQVMKWNGSNWVASADNTGGGGSLSSLTAATSANAISNLNFTQSWDWSTATTQNPMTMSANALTLGSLLNLTSSSGSLNSTNGILNVANTSASITGTVARIQSNSTAGSGMTVLANGNVGIGTTTPGQNLTVIGTIESTSGGIKFPDGTVQSTSAIGGTNNTMVSTWPDAIKCNMSSPGNATIIFYLNYAPNVPDNKYYYRHMLNTVGDYYISYNADGSYSTSSGITVHDCNISISSLYSGGKAYNFAKGPAAQWLSGSGGAAYYNAGNIGIGTTSPLGKLDVSGSSSSTNLVSFDTNRSISMVNLDTTANNAQGLALRSTGTNGTSIQSGVKLLGVNTARTATTITTDFAILTNNAGTITEKMRVLANGNVGIGTVSPGSALDVSGTIRADTICDRTGANCKTVSSGWGNIAAASMVANWPDAIVCDNGADRSILYYDTRDQAGNIVWYSKASGGASHYLRFYATTGAFYDITSFTGFSACSGKSLATLVSEGRTFGLLGGGVDWTASGGNIYRTGGNVGIGTAAPNNKLEVAGTILTTGSASIGTNLINGSFGNSTSRTFMNSTGYIWSTMASGGGSANYYAHRHDTASPFISFGYGAAGVGSVTTDGSSVSYNTTSDRRLKENITETRLGLSDLLKIKAYEYNFINDAKKKPVTGFIAQELQTVFPDAVHTNGDSGTEPIDPKKGVWGVDYGRLTPLIVKSVQDLKVELDEVGGRCGSAQSQQSRQLASLKIENAAKNQKILDLEKQNREINARLEKIEKTLKLK